MTKAVQLHEQLVQLEKRMTDTAVSLKRFSDRLTSGEIIDPYDYNVLTSGISNLSDMQNEFSTALSGISNDEKSPSNLKDANALIEAFESRLDKESLIRMSEHFKHVSAKEGYTECLREIVEKLDRLCEDDRPENTVAAVSAYENLLSAITSRSNDERLILLEKCESYFRSEIITSVIFNRFSYNAESIPVFAGASEESGMSEISTASVESIREEISSVISEPSVSKNDSLITDPQEKDASSDPEKIDRNAAGNDLPRSSKNPKNSKKADKKNKDLIKNEKVSGLISVIKNPGFPYNVKDSDVAPSNISRIDRISDMGIHFEKDEYRSHNRIKIVSGNNDNENSSEISANENTEVTDKKNEKAAEAAEIISLPAESIDEQNSIVPEPVEDDTAEEEFSAEEQTSGGEDPIFQNKYVPIETARQNLLRMIGSGKIYCACAYLRALCKNDPANSLFSEYSKLAYAAYDPAFECKYYSTSVMTVFGNIDQDFAELDNDLYLATALRTLFYCDYPNDFGIKQLSDMVKVTAESISPAIKDLMYELVSFRKEASIGIDAFADYRMKKQQEYGRIIEENVTKARQFYDGFIMGNVKENITHARYLNTKKMIYSRTSDLAICLETIINNKNHNDDDLNLVKSYLDENGFAKDSEKPFKTAIDNYIDKFWEAAGDTVNVQHKSSELISKARNNLFCKLESIISIIRDWTEMKQHLNTYVFAGRYDKEKHIISDKINAALSECKKELDSGSSHAGLMCIINVLEEFKERMNGSYFDGNRRYFYVDFLRYGYVMLDENYFPVNDDCTVFLNSFGPEERIAEHSLLPERSFNERVSEIFGSDKMLAEDYGCARLIKKYLESTSGEDAWDVNNDIDANCEQAKKQCGQHHSSFIGTLELAQSYGKIPLIETKENIRMREELIYKKTLADDNYGFYLRFINACERFIDEIAKSRAAALKQHLDGIKDEYNGSDTDKERVAVLINQANELLGRQDYTVVEDIINRIDRDDLDDYSVDTYSSDTLDMFIKEFEDIYKVVKNTSSTGARSLKPPYSNPRNKDERAANDLIMSFPYSGSAEKEKIETLLKAMNFNCKSISIPDANVEKTSLFDVLLKKPLNNTKQNYTHVIAPFGSIAVENGFRVVCLRGRYSPDMLIKKFSELGETKNCMVLLDSPLSISDRRELAYKVKKASFSKVFIIVDAVVVKFLSNHYSEAKVNLNLMEITMPFSNYQPYYESASASLPVEMFMGRRKQLDSIKSPKGANIVYGGRQLGKTALLKMAKNDLNRNENGDRAVFIDAKDCDCGRTAKKLSMTLVEDGIFPEGSETDDWELLCSRIRKRLMSGDEENRIPFLLILIDEADTFIEDSKAVNYMPIKELKNIQQDGVGRFKFVIAGLHNVVKFERKNAESNNSVLAHLQSLNIAPFTANEARELLEVPLHSLGIRFPQDKTYLIPTILASTNYFPGLIHTYCFKLIEAMQNSSYAGYNTQETPPYNISEDHFKKVLADPNFNHEVNQKFIITLELGEDRYYYIIAYILAFLFETSDGVSGFTANEVYSVGIEYEIKKFANMDKDSVAALMDEMCDLNVLSFNRAQKTYSFARHRFIQMLSAKDIEQEILSFSEV